MRPPLRLAGYLHAIRTINTYLAALPEASGLSDAERRAAAGFAKTLKALHGEGHGLRPGMGSREPGRNAQAGGLGATLPGQVDTDDEFVDELLYNRLYSLMWTQGTRWIDARRYDRLDDLPIDRPGDSVYESMLVPADECAARELGAPCQPLGG